MRPLITLLFALTAPAWAQIPIDPDYQLWIGDTLAGRVFTPPGQDRCAYEELWYLFPGTPDVTVGDPTGVGDPFRVLPVAQEHADARYFVRAMEARHPGGRLVTVWNWERGGACLE